MPADADPAVWRQIVDMLSEIDDLYPESNRSAFETFARKELRPIADRLGPDPKPGEDGNLTNLRNSILSALSRFGDQPRDRRSAAPL